jgi:formate/nitrite transporter FocA (FNT family)
MTALGDAVDWALLISSEFEVDFLTALGNLGYLLEQGAIEVGDYMANLLELYLFNIVGAGLAGWDIHKTERKAEH